MKRALFLILLLLLILERCAQIQPPSGGPKDTEPPEVKRSVPPNGTVNFQGNRFMLEFDEYVKTSGVYREMIVSPPLEESPEVTISGKEMVVEWEDSLMPGQTYSFRFGNSVRDITEGNPASNLVYALSTGEKLDSLHFQGRVVDARSMEGVEGVLAMLYRERADSVPRTKQPFYFSRTDEEGHFDIPYLADGRYKFFALKDKNRDQRFDLPDERIGFKKAPVRPYPADSSGDLLVRLFQEKRDDQFLEKRSVHPGRTVIELAQAAEEVDLSPLGSEKLPWSFAKYHQAGSDTAIFWFPDPSMSDSIDLALEADGEPLDTFMVRNASELEDAGKASFLEQAFEDPLDWHRKARFEAASPLKELDPSAIIAVSDSDTVATDPRISGPASRKLVLGKKDAYQEEGLQLTLLPGAVLDTFGRANRDTLGFSFDVRDKEYYGKITLFLKSRGKDQQVILRLLDPRGKTLRRRVDSTGKSLELPYLAPGSVRIELILDRIANGKWDPGRYPDRQPEQVLYYPDTLKVRSNWEQEIEWKGIGE